MEIQFHPKGKDFGIQNLAAGKNRTKMLMFIYFYYSNFFKNYFSQSMFYTSGKYRSIQLQLEQTREPNKITFWLK